MEKILAYIKEQQKEYHEHTSAYKVLRKLEAELPGLFSDPSPSQVLTAEEDKLEALLEYLDTAYLIDRKLLSISEVEKNTRKAIQEYSTLQTQQLQNRVKELEEQLRVMPTRKHQIVSEVVELREQVKQAHNEAIEACFKLIKRVGWLPDLEVFDGTALKIMEELEKEIKK